MDFETEVGKCDPFDMDCIDAARAKYSGIPSILASQPVNSLDALNARGFQMEADALTRARLTSLTDTTLPPGSGVAGFDVLSTLSPSQEAKVREAIALQNAEDAYAEAKAREAEALSNAEEAYQDAVLYLRAWNEDKGGMQSANLNEEAFGPEQKNFFMEQKGLQNAVQVTKAALEGLGGSPYASLLKRGIVTTAGFAGTMVNRAMNAIGGPNFNQVTLNPLQGSVTGQYSDSGQYTPLKITETKDGTIVAASTGIPALDAIIGGSTTTDADGSISGIKTPDFGTIWENVGGAVGAVGALGLGGENASETFDPTAVVADDTVVTNPGTVVTLEGLSPQEIAYKKAMKVFEDAGGGETGKAAVLKALEDNGLTIADLSEQTGVSIAELETFLTPTATGVGLDDLTVSGTAATGTMGPEQRTPQQIAYAKAMKVFDEAGGGEAGKAAVIQALADNNLSLQDLATQTGVSLADVQAFLYPVVDNTTTSTVSDLDKINTLFGTGTGLQGESAKGILGLDTTGPTLTKRVEIGAKPEDITKRVDYSPLDLKKGIGALDQKLDLKKGIGALEQQTDLKRGVTLTGEPSIGGGISELRSGPSFGGAVTLETGPNAPGTLEHVPGASTRYRSSLGEDFPGAAETLRASLTEGAAGDLKGTLRAGSLEGTLTAGEVFKGELKGSSSAEKTSTLRGSSSSSSSSGGMPAPMGDGSPGYGAGDPGDLAEIEYLFQRFGDTIFAPELTKDEENELLYPYS
tara:strand:- start:970 stop:3213 length:2244 start_codon:yes stop_codon:yes gene_type:complete